MHYLPALLNLAISIPMPYLLFVCCRASKLQRPLEMEDGTILPSYTIRLWSRASGRYLQILPIGAIPYARGVFGPTGPLQMVVLDEPEAIVLLRCASHPQFHLGFHRTSVTGMVRICFCVYMHSLQSYTWIDFIHLHLLLSDSGSFRADVRSWEGGPR